jgi:hypothetical protein
MILEFVNAMMTMLLMKFMLNDVPHAAGILGSEQEKALTDQYGVWAVSMARRFCPTNDMSCIEDQAKRFYTNMRAGRKVS